MALGSKQTHLIAPRNVIYVPVIKAHDVKHSCHNKDAKVAAFASLCQLKSFCEITWISDVRSVPFAVLDQTFITALDYARYMNAPDDTALNQVGIKRQW